MPEDQNIEWKRSWHDDYLKWICGFANAYGGTIFIGIDDTGEVFGLDDYQKLMEDVPSKVRNHLGIICDVRLKSEDDKFYMEIITSPASVAVSLRGRYYYRTGSTKIELTGTKLNEFLLTKSGKTWDDVIEPSATIDDIDGDSLRLFLKDAIEGGRMPNTSQLSDIAILEKLRLYDSGHLKRAAIILFGNDPGRFYPNTFVKIGRFGKDGADLIHQDVIEGNLITVLRSVLEILGTKYLIKPIRYKGIQRIEQGEYPLDALREIILNALVHRNYMGAPTQIRVYDHHISVWNDGDLISGITFDMLKTTHPSKPRNPIIAQVCFFGGYIEQWGRGTLKVYDSCAKALLPVPSFQSEAGGLSVTIYKDRYDKNEQYLLGLSLRQQNAVEYLKVHNHIDNSSYQKLNEVSERTARRDLVELVEKQIVIKEGSNKGTIYRLNDGR